MPTIPPQCDRLSYPGLMPNECVILSAWLRVHESDYERFDYNTRIGAGVDPGPTWGPDIRRMAVMNSQLRIDAIGWVGNQASLIEVKQDANVTAIGQLLTYDAVWRMDNPSLPPPHLIVVSNTLQPNMGAVTSARGIRPDVVPVDAGKLQSKPYY